MARFYDAVVGPLLLPIRREVRRIAQTCGARNILDICCGTGAQCVLLNAAGLRVVGVDISPSMLREAVRKSPPGIDYRLEDATRLSFPSGSFDAAVISFALHEKEYAARTQIMKEAVRVLAPGGMILLVDYAAPVGFADGIGSLSADLVERMAGAEHHRLYVDYMKRGALDAVLAEHELETVETRRFHMGATALIAAKPRDPV